jgi:hypothetical protein
VVDGGVYMWRWFMVEEVYMIIVMLYVKMEFGPWKSINPSRQFPESVMVNLPD